MSDGRVPAIDVCAATSAAEGFDRGAVRRWIDDDVDPQDAAQLQDLLSAADVGDLEAAAELTDRFAGSLTFGTAGLRGPLRAGPNGMNRTVVRRAAAGLAAWLIEHGQAGSVVAIGYDARHGSAEFAADSAAVLAAAGLRAGLLPGPLPTPVLAFAVRRLGASAGVMVTASHNPPRDNGYKVYGADGAQIIAPTDREIEAAIQAVGASSNIPRSEDYERLDDRLVGAYVEATARLVEPPAAPLTVIHTALHGVGTAVIDRVFARAGYPPLVAVAAQAQPDPDFPTVAFPNPEEPGAIDLALDLARESGADLVVANDPDADRCAVAVEFADTGWRMLTGDELGVLLADALLTKGRRGTYATTIVSSSMLRALAEDHGVGFAETLTGFKWIVRAGDDLVFGYEEALGYAVALDAVRDKDGISAALVAVERAAALRAAGSSFPQRLEELAARYGRHLTGQVSLRVSDPHAIATTMRRLRADPPAQLLGQDLVDIRDLQPDADVIIWRAGPARVVLRPSGTEPKLKAYLEVVEPGASAGTAVSAEATLQRLRAEVGGLLGV